MATPAPTKPRRTTFEIVVFFLGIALLLAIVGVIGLNAFDKPVDDILKQVIIGCLTGIAGILAKDTGKTQDVNVVNRPTDPVPVDAGHVSVDLLALLLVVTTGVFFGGLVLHFVLT